MALTDFFYRCRLALGCRPIVYNIEVDEWAYVLGGQMSGGGCSGGQVSYLGANNRQ